MIRKIHWIVMAMTAMLCAACDAHIDVPDTAVRPGHILCEDGTALSYTQYEQSGKRAIAVVFDAEQRDGVEGNGYAVYLWNIAPQAFADSLASRRAHRATSRPMTGIRTPLRYMTRGKRLRRWQKRFSTVAIRAECLRTFGSADTPAVRHAGGGQSFHRTVRRTSDTIG